MEDGKDKEEAMVMESPIDPHELVSDDDEIDYSIKPEFYDPLHDEKDELWVHKKRKGRISDAVLSCPACFTSLCLDCQRMASRNLRSNNSNPESSNANANANENANANVHIENTMEGRFNQLMQAFVASQESQSKMIEVMQKQAQPTQIIMPARALDLNDLFDKFKKRVPPEFFGNEDPLDADEWIVQLEKIFEVFRCTGKERIQLAAYMFRGTAEMWWKSVKTPFDTVEDETAWESFSKLFRAKYIPPHITALKIAEFETLKQGENSVQVYEQQFTNLSRFAPSLVKTEEDKVMRFIRGLNPNIKEMVTSVTLATYEENLKRAYWAEESIKEKAIYNQSLRVAQTQGRNQGAGYQQQQSQYQQQAKRPKPDKARRVECFHCGGSHPSAECRKLTGACFECGLQGHRVNDCPRKQGQGVRNAAPRPPIAAQPLRQAPPNRLQQPNQQQPRVQQQQQQQYRLAGPQQNRGHQRPQGQQQGQQQRYQQRPQQQGRLNALDIQEGEEAGGVVEGMKNM